MTVDLNMGVVGYVAVHDVHGKELYRASVQSKTEIDAWIETHRVSVAGWGCLKASFAPVRVDNWGDLKKDLFLPTFVNLVLKINNRCLLIFAALFALPWDVLTLPFRLAAIPIRLYEHHHLTYPDLPVETLIKTSPVFEEVKKHGVVRLFTHLEETKATKTFGEKFPEMIMLPEKKDLPYEAEQTTHEVVCDVYLKAFPWNESSYKSRGSLKMFVRIPPNFKWNCHTQVGGDKWNTVVETFSA